MKKRNLILSVILAFSAAFLFGGCLSDKGEKKAADEEVLSEPGVTQKKSNIGYDADYLKINLVSAKITKETVGGVTTTYAEGYIEAAKPSYDRTVTIHYANDGDLSKWYDDTASIKYYCESPNGAPGSLEILYFKKKINQKITFALKYSRPGGRDYWDNNNTANYLLGTVSGTPAFILGYSSVGVEKYSALTNSVKYKRALSGSIILKNIAYTKDVKVIYSIDGWKTSQSITANYGEGYYNNTERWNFDGYLDLSVTSAQFKISYKVNGIEYIDNNFGKFYTAKW